MFQRRRQLSPLSDWGSWRKAPLAKRSMQKKGITMQDKPVVLVTGANKGIGLQIAKDLAAHGFTVLVGSRNHQGWGDGREERRGGLHRCKSNPGLLFRHKRFPAYAFSPSDALPSEKGGKK
jgi:hypothetical protein